MSPLSRSYSDSIRNIAISTFNLTPLYFIKNKNKLVVTWNPSGKLSVNSKNPPALTKGPFANLLSALILKR